MAAAAKRAAAIDWVEEFRYTIFEKNEHSYIAEMSKNNTRLLKTPSLCLRTQKSMQSKGGER